MKVGTFKGYDIHLSDRYPKKYYTIVDGKRVYFGDQRYQQFHDKIGYYSFLDHNDHKRRESYWNRHGRSKDKLGTAGWFALHVLW